ncbi:MAG: TatD family deoxyribonuclease [Thermoprotei archaeon]|nr:MAG: TatD family deoxyribonuclease [Thermoprotei archaeon]RLF02145.1 MAG: TatD family deoxyribonuclease [Thermoprotei archaeon]
MFVDAHCHLHEFSEEEVERFSKEFYIVAVSDDYESSLKTIELASSFPNIIPCVGIHPWEVKNVSNDEVERIIRLVAKKDIICLGEIGLDKLFTPQTFERQLEVFKSFISLASEQDLIVNVHAAGAWREVFELVTEFSMKRVIFHWYTGPLNLLKRVVERGYYITVNPAVKIQKKLRSVLKQVDIHYMLTESDGPYKYRGLFLAPPMVRELVEYISQVRGISTEDLRETVLGNFKRLFKVSIN